MPYWIPRPLFHVAAATFLLMAAGAGHAAVPAGFTDLPVTSVEAPTAIAFTPDGRLLITQQSGSLRVFQGGLLGTPALTIPAASICTNSERGLLGVAVHPQFASNRFIYLFYTAEEPGGCVNRVSRFTLPDSNVVNPASELILIDNMPSPAGNHNAGDLHFGKDGYLYISIGDGGCDWANDSGCAGSNDAARDEHVLTGKILRITDSGDIPPDNPFQGPGTDRCNDGGTSAGTKCQETFAWGLRNPFRIAFDPNAAGTRFFINDVGQGLWEEIDEAQAGADYGWNICEGAHANNSTGPCSSAPPGMVAPIFEYRHGVSVPGTTSPTNCNSITGGAFVPNGLWTGFDGSYLFADFICGWIFKLTNSGGTWSASDFATNLGGGSAVHLTFGPYGGDQALYYTTYAGGGQVRVIADVPPPLDFFTVVPCRVVDTRNSPGPYGGPALAAGSWRSFTLVGLCGIPPTAAAVAANLTVVSPTAAGHLTLYPGGIPAPAASTINFSPGRTRANNAVLLLGLTGDLGVLNGMASGSTHFVLDVVGYFE